MIQTIVSAIAVFVATSIDYLLILTILFSQVRTKNGITHIVGGQYLGTAILVAVSLLAAYVLHFIPEEWMIGFLGLVPIILGIRVAVKGDDDDGEDEAGELAEKMEARKSSRLFWTITLITIASGGDNLGVYIPYFASLSVGAILVALLVFAVATTVLCYLGYKLSTIRLISNTLEKYEKIIVPIVYIALGIYIMIESGTFGKLLQLIGWN
ncbi:MAG: CadD family cadmium resistance transporter [Rectinemataceae bacterium]